ncbi:aspartate--tRNA ligase, mitochondrial isoform X3 [Cherax quadricarinatus]|uniref:aspartate--tRNA ligase, mitochondrial isoform X3 n=1 Tax=Cherax quadricarinatus TaxID=27406 RepID=UPI00387E4A58
MTTLLQLLSGRRNIMKATRIISKTAEYMKRQSGSCTQLPALTQLYRQKSPFCMCHTVGSSLKSHTCGELRAHHVGQKVKLRGFLQYQRMGKFAVLRDAFGKTQVLINDEDTSLVKLLSSTTFESYVEVMGIVCHRPDSQLNRMMPTGEIEVLASNYQVLSKARQDLPFLIRDFNKDTLPRWEMADVLKKQYILFKNLYNPPNEQLRLKYRYLDLRHSELQNNLRLKSQGAQEFVVPSRHPGKFYSLVQSPQTYKQLAMIGGFDKYFQFAVCYRDEGAKHDRQPEFMQVDLEMTDVTMREVQHLTENLLVFSWPTHLAAICSPFPVLTYNEAMSSYGVDKPDTRFDWKLQDVTHHLHKCGATVLENILTLPGNSAHAFVIPGGQLQVTKKVVASWENLARTQHNLLGVSVFYICEDLTLKGAVSKKMSAISQRELIQTLGAVMGDILVMAVGPTNDVLGLLGKLRLLAAKTMEESGIIVRHPEHFNFLWVVDFPLFTKDDKGNVLPAHHPFTLPREDDTHYLYTDPFKAKSQHYDLVLNGCEVGGGSIRIHDPEMQRFVLQDIMGVEPSTLGFLIEALESGAPPHGGIALGFDRLIAELCRANSIRDVIAFPKTMEGRCLMSGAPGDITQEEEQLYHISVTQRDTDDSPKNC